MRIRTRNLRFTGDNASSWLEIAHSIVVHLTCASCMQAVPLLLGLTTFVRLLGGETVLYLN